MRLACFILLFASVAFGSAAQTGFRAYASSAEMIEGGRIDTMVIVTDGERLTLRSPRGYGTRVDTDKKAVIFTEKTGGASITVQVTANSPGGLPDDDTLRTKAMASNPGGSFLQMASCSTGYKPAKYVDSVRLVRPKLAIRVRHLFLPCPDGTLEIIYSANGDDFEKSRNVLNLVLGSLRVERLAPPNK